MVQIHPSAPCLRSLIGEGTRLLIWQIAGSSPAGGTILYGGYMIDVNARRVLLLNQSYLPLCIITIRDAVGLIMRGVVDTVEGTAAKLRTPSGHFHVPSILRVRHYVNVPHRTIQWSRRAVLARDDYTCAYCALSIGHITPEGHAAMSDSFTVDHVIPVSHGGKSTFGNTVCACYWCNHRKGSRDPHEAGMPLLIEPKRPRVDYLVISGNVPTEWKIYIAA